MSLSDEKIKELLSTKTRAPLIIRWTRKVQVPEDRNDCWIWKGALDKWGYGLISRGGKHEGLVLAHRFAYEHFVGPIPDGHEIRHTCHVSHCVNPMHLTTGTRADNVHDQHNKGRYIFIRKESGELVKISKVS